MVTQQLFPPPAALRNYVRYFWSLDCKDIGLSAYFVKILADRHPRLIFQNLDGRSAIRHESGSWLAPAFLGGADTHPTTYIVTGPYSHVGVSFYPHALHHLFGINAQELIDTSADLTNFCPRGLYERMYEAVSHHERIVLLTEFLTGQLQRGSQEAQLINNYVFNQSTFTTGAGIDELLSHYPLSQRQLERRFQQWVGVPPKMYLRLIRFEQALGLLSRACFQQIQTIAFDLNYADHSHFTREFRAFSGYTPRDYLVLRKKAQESSSFIVDD